MLESIKSEINFLQKQIEKLELESRKIIDDNPDLKLKFERLTAIKGVGEKTAMAILIDVPDVEHFEKSGQFAALAGVTPSHFQSGSSVNGKSKISRIGSKNVRKVLYMSAVNVKNHNQQFKNFVQKLQKKGKAPSVIAILLSKDSIKAVKKAENSGLQ